MVCSQLAITICCLVTANLQHHAASSCDYKSRFATKRTGYCSTYRRGLKIKREYQSDPDAESTFQVTKDGSWDVLISLRKGVLPVLLMYLHFIIITHA